MKFAYTLKDYKKNNFVHDLISGIIIAAVSIPISMGYAQIAGLPVVYGLYGSVFPIILFALLSTSRQFIFGVDAAPAAMVGASVMSLGIMPESDAALKVVPLITLFTALWLLLFGVLRVGRLVSYISSPVMGGFISGICTTIIMMQVPKLYGGSAGTGELHELLNHITTTTGDINVLSLKIGIITLMILLISKKLFSKLPMAVIVMFAGAFVSFLQPDLLKGVKMLPAVDRGLPSIVLPVSDHISIEKVIMISFSVAMVIMAETLLAENNFARKNNYTINANQELIAFGMANMAAAFTGCCPVNGSVSRTAMNEQYGGRTQATGLVAGVIMAGILLLGTGFIQYLPVPVLTAIVISALIGATEFELLPRLWKANKKEFFIFWGAFFGVLIFGTINGVLIGVVLSFVEMIIRASKPPRCFLGIQPGHTHFRSFDEFRNVYPIKNVVVYRFSSNLFFANIDVFQNDILDSIRDDTKAVIVDASGIGDIDVTAAECIGMLYKQLKNRNIRFYMTEHIAGLNEQMRRQGLEYMLAEGAVRRTVNVALKDMGIRKPYPLEGVENYEVSPSRKRAENSVQEYIWGFGGDAEYEIEKQIMRQITNLSKNGDLDSISQMGNWGYMDSIDEDEWLEHLEEHLKELVRVSGHDEETLAKTLEHRRELLLEKITHENEELAKKFYVRREKLDAHLKNEHPEVYEKVIKYRMKHNNI
ncbi:MAG: SulP family inorganic anion transporter [Lachnospiraceae bacterium]|nr:SulP family inorganic anion transporter [Lachnoclostridium sp.]MDY2598498.1 SulP family inorganic anion transporter [Lachnospiraceae bacterium]